MAFSFGNLLGGIVKNVGGAIIHATPIGAAIDAVKTLGGIVKSGSTVGKIISTPIMALPAPRIITTNAPTQSEISRPLIAAAGGAVAMTPSGVPHLPVLSAPPGGGTVKIIPSQRGAVPAGQPGGFGIVPGAGTRGHYTKRGLWSPRRRPRMNPMNVRAARRAVSRIHAAEKLFRRILTVSHPGKAHGRVAPKRRN